jgi:hypothetical protein
LQKIVLKNTTICINYQGEEPMKHIDTVAGTELTDIVQPFAALMDGPGRVLPRLGSYMLLKEFYGASDHPDFHHPEGYEPWEMDVNIQRNVALPFSLALGLHAAGPRQVNREATLETYEVYAAKRPLAVIETFFAGDQMRYQRRRATHALASAIVKAAVDPPTRLSYSRDRIEQAIAFSREENLLSRRQARLLGSTANLVHVL